MSRHIPPTRSSERQPPQRWTSHRPVRSILPTADPEPESTLASYLRTVLTGRARRWQGSPLRGLGSLAPRQHRRADCRVPNPFPVNPSRPLRRDDPRDGAARRRNCHTEQSTADGLLVIDVDDPRPTSSSVPPSPCRDDRAMADRTRIGAGRDPRRQRAALVPRTHPSASRKFWSAVTTPEEP